MKRATIVLLASLLTACGTSDSHAESQVLPPGKIMDFSYLYARNCSGCHGTDGKGTPKGSSIVDGSFLALVSDQYLRTTIIAGRPELNHPDWRADVPGRPMQPQEVTDVVAWLAAQRKANPGQPYANNK